MAYNMEEFFKSCVDAYVDLAAKEGPKEALTKRVLTLFLPDDPTDFEQAIPCTEGHAFECTWCRHTLQIKEVQNTIDTLNNLEGDDKTGIKPKRSKYIHKFDSISYPLLKMELTGARNYLPQENVRPHLIHCGVD